ncbi:MAG: hypothetical protein K2O13_12275 [Lachnospiraceae bacterium]|nr:hypothetical protein [Lachnospiraceae bacterium]
MEDKKWEGMQEGIKEGERKGRLSIISRLLAAGNGENSDIKGYSML